MVSRVSTISVVARATARDGRRDELVAAFSDLFDHVESAEPGTVTYILMEDDEDVNTVWFYEEYDSEDALAAHQASDAIAAVGPALGSLLAGPPEVRRCTPVRRKER